MANVPLKFNDSLKRGDTGKWDLAFTVSLVGATVRAFYKLTPTDVDAAAFIKRDSAALGGIVVTDAGNGLCRVTISPADTAALSIDTTLFYDVEVTEADGTVTTVVEGQLSVTTDITQA